MKNENKWVKAGKCFSHDDVVFILSDKYIDCAACDENRNCYKINSLRTEFICLKEKVNEKNENED